MEKAIVPHFFSNLRDFKGKPLKRRVENTILIMKPGKKSDFVL